MAGKKEEYIAKVEARLQEWSTKIDELKVQAHLGKAEAQEEYERQIKMLREKESRLSRKLNELRDAGGEAWDEIKFGIDSAVDDLKDAFGKAFDKLK